VNVIGYLKTVIVFVGGYMFFSTELNSKNIFGISMTLIGLMWYTYVKIYPEGKKEKIQVSDEKEKPEEKV
jgi:solute carrier family 35, member E3